MTRPRMPSGAILQALNVTGGWEQAGAIAEFGRGVAELSRLFTRERGVPPDAYLEDDRLRAAYEAYYLPVNLAKVQALLAELPDQTGEAVGPKRSWSVLDLGSGPGSGALAALDWVAQRAGPAAPCLEVTAVDWSQASLTACRKLWDAYQRLTSETEARLTVQRADLQRDKRLPAGPYDLILLANCLDEVYRADRDPIQRRATLVRGLLDRLGPGGTLMIVEPALRETTRHLHEVRDALLRERACTIYSPCLHESSCPALAKEEDWCHEERPWSPSPLVAAIDREVGFIKDALKFSYLLLRKDGRTIVPRRPGVYRVVSELREMKGEKRAWLCNEVGRPEVGRLGRERSETNEAVDRWHRGAIVRVSEIVRKERKGREATVGRIPADATVEMIRPV